MDEHGGSMSTFLGDKRTALEALSGMNRDLLKYPLLRDLKQLERDTIVKHAQRLQKQLGRAPLLLDVGCGLGEDMAALSGRVGGMLVGIDYNEFAIALCQANLQDPRFAFLIRDVRKTGFLDLEFDLAYVTVNTLGNCGFSERHTWIGELTRISRLTLVSLYPNTGDPLTMGLEHRLAYYRELLGPDANFDGHKFSAPSRAWVGRTFTTEEIQEMFDSYGVLDYQFEQLSPILVSLAIPSQRINDKPDPTRVRSLEWDR